MTKKAKKSLMKVSNEELLNAIWMLQVRNTARHCVCSYVGNRKGMIAPSQQNYAQDMHITSRMKLGVSLSNGHLLKRLIRLIDAGLIEWSVRGCSFWINNDKSKEVFDYACEWWTSHDVPSGYDAEGKRMRCNEIDDFDSLTEQLERHLVEKFVNNSCTCSK